MYSLVVSKQSKCFVPTTREYIVNYFCEFVHDAQMLVGAGSGVAVETDVDRE